MDDDFDDPEFWAAADRAVAASAPVQRQQPEQRSQDKTQQPTPQRLDKRPLPRTSSAPSEGGRIVQPTPQRLDKPLPGRAAGPAGEGPKIVQPTPQVLPQRGSGSTILVSPRQKGNPLLLCIKSIPWEYSDILADYGLGATTCALFLSLKYHRLYPEYVYGRIRNIRGKYNLRILLTLVDIENHEDPLRELAKTSLINNVTLILCWSAAEAARYLELYKSYEHAGFKAIQGQQGTSYVERLVDFVTVPRGINKSDAVSLVSNFGSLKNAINAEPEQIGIIGGWGEVKVKRWCSAVDEPFRVKKAARRTIADVASTASAVMDPRLARKSAQAPAPAATAAAGAGDTGPTSTAKPRQFRFFDPDEDDEEAMVVAAIEESKNTSRQPPASMTSPRETREPEAVSEGVAAALARLREQG